LLLGSAGIDAAAPIDRRPGSGTWRATATAPDGPGIGVLPPALRCEDDDVEHARGGSALC